MLRSRKWLLGVSVTWALLATAVAAWSIVRTPDLPATREDDALAGSAADGGAEEVLLAGGTASPTATPDLASAGEFIKSLSEECRRNVRSACGRVADIYEQGRPGVSADLSKAAEFRLLGCEAKDAVSCAEYGSILLAGRGVPRDPEEAVTYLRKACYSDATTCYQLGAAYESDSAILNVPRALYAYQRGCHAGYAPDCKSVGDLLLGGKLKLDVEGAIRAYEAGCSAGNGDSCEALAALYTNGAHVDPDRETAFEYRKAACIRGSSSACDELGSSTDGRSLTAVVEAP